MTKTIKTLMTLAAVASINSYALAEEKVITTADRGDGKAGYGSDIWMTEKVPNREAIAFQHLMLVRRGDNSIGVVRFDLSQLKDMKIDNAELKLFSFGRKGNKIKILGLKDSDADELFTEKVTWYTFPAFKKADGKFEQDCLKEDKVVELAVLEQGDKNQWATISAEKLTDFVKANKNSVVVFIIQAEGPNSNSFGTSFKDGKKFKDSKNAPQLVLKSGD